MLDVQCKLQFEVIRGIHRDRVRRDHFKALHPREVRSNLSEAVVQTCYIERCWFAAAEPTDMANGIVFVVTNIIVSFTVVTTLDL
jgi:hypothetical protein